MNETGGGGWWGTCASLKNRGRGVRVAIVVVAAADVPCHLQKKIDKIIRNYTEGSRINSTASIGKAVQLLEAEQLSRITSR